MMDFLWTAIGDFLAYVLSWRWLLCIVLAVVIIVVSSTFIPEGPLRTVVSVATVIGALSCAIVWERRSR
jgi:hypothetical protein